MSSPVELWRARLREAVDRSDKKHSAIAWDVGICPATLSRILTGRTRRPSFEIVVRIAHLVGERVGWVLGENPYSLSLAEQELLRRAVATIRKIIGDA